MANLITEKIFRFNLPDGKKKERIDLFLANSIENASRSRIQRLIEAGCVTVNQKITKSNYKVAPRDYIEVCIPISPRPEFPEPEDIPLEIVYEDEYLIIVNKGPGMAVHPSLGNYSGTMVHALLHHTQKLSANNVPGRPGIVHRIDKDTSGLIIVAKDNYTHAHLAAQFSKHTISREYEAIVWGAPKEQEGVIDTYICRSKKDRKKFTTSVDEGKRAVTMYKVAESYEFASLVRLKLKTGRTHQIRVHMAHIGHPVFGDAFYGGRAVIYGSQLPKIKQRVANLLEVVTRQALHAKTLGFIHPMTKEHMVFDSKLPKDMQYLLNEIRTNGNDSHD